MAGEPKREPRCRNSWRPSDGPLASLDRDRRRQQRSPTRSITSRRALDVSSRPATHSSPYDQQSAEPQAKAWNRSMTPAPGPIIPEPPAQTFKNPNLIPVTPHHARISKDALLAADPDQDEEPEEEQLPQIWHPSIDDLIRRTARDYDLVMNYERDAEGGQRWLQDDIARIRDVGKHLHGDIFALRRWQRVVTEQGDQDKQMMMHVKREANFLKLLCERVQRAINKYEQKCGFELLRDGIYAQDEDGNFYKPTTPQEYVAEGGYLQNLAQHNTETGEDETPAYRPEEYYDEPTENSRMNWPSTGARTPLLQTTKRNLAFDFAFQRTPFEKLKDEAARQKTEVGLRPTFRHPDRVLHGKITKTYTEASHGKQAPCHDIDGKL